MKGNKKALAAVLVASVFAAGCATDGSGGWGTKQSIGTAVGAVAGVLLGSQIGGGSGRTVAMIVGAFAGGALGNWIGSSLDAQDQEALAASTQRALASGQTETWTSDHSGASAVIRPVSSETKTQQATVKRSEKIVQVQNLAALNETWQAASSVNLRAAPTASATKVGGLASGQTFTALGRTSDNWIAVGRKGVTVGYVYGPLVKPVVVAKADQAVDLDGISVAQARTQGFDLDTIEPARPVVEQVAVQTTCRTMQYDVTTAKGSESKTVNACQAPDGAWQIG
ncbi:SH3 domain-containing protein [Castellaniella defragrans]|uniref:Surface antigen n=1 Tax=Castellaniella defragrans TaxID=75697 RepID=A0A7W9TPI4_CASDE|nr:SH3 domain-containing protein [Castellaniella defragrans]KAB0606026.1 SH3 domain-containing protein [Castellaniella defragrans]MBB6083427.1 surface antigen [Castellaniella defragrans]